MVPERRITTVLQVQVSTDGGATWDNVGDPIPRFDGTDRWKPHSVSLDGYVGQPGVLVGVLGISDHGNDIHLDDLAVEIKATYGHFVKRKL